MDYKFKGKTALVTGAGSQIGIGKETALLLAKEGCEAVVVTDVNLQDAEKTADMIKELGCRSMAVKADITSGSEVDAMIEKSIKEFGKIDILCNIAGGILQNDNVPMDEQDSSIWEKQMRLNLFGTMNVSKAAVLHMRARKYGVIVNVSSGSTQQYWMGVGVYAMSKYALDLFTKQLATDEAKAGIRVNCVAPGPAATNFGGVLKKDEPFLSGEHAKQMEEMLLKDIPLGRIGTTIDIANAVVFLASDVSSYMTGQIVHVSGGSVM